MTNIQNPPLPEIPHLEVADGEPMADSREVASRLDRDHRHVLQAIRELDLSNDFKSRNFRLFKIKDLTKESGESTSHVLMTEPGFMSLCRSLRGGVAAAIFESFINEFYRMREELRRPKPVEDTRDQFQIIEDQHRDIGVMIARRKELESQLLISREETEAMRTERVEFERKFESAKRAMNQMIGGKDNVMFIVAAKICGVPQSVFRRECRNAGFLDNRTQQIVPVTKWTLKTKLFVCSFETGFQCMVTPLGIAWLAVHMLEKGLALTPQEDVLQKSRDILSLEKRIAELEAKKAQFTFNF